MDLHVHPIDLELRDTFVTAYGARRVQPSLLVELRQDGLGGWGEAVATSYYGLDREAMVGQLEAVRAGLERHALSHLDTFFDDCLSRLPVHSFVRSALDVAAHDLWGRMQGLPLYRLWGLSADELPQSSYTLSLGPVEQVLAQQRAHPWPLYKIKLGGPDDLEVLRALRQQTPAPFYVDANTGWTSSTFLRHAGELAALGVQLVEQPLPVAHWAEQARLCRQSSLPLFADESCQGPDSLPACARAFHGINIKLVKCGGLRPARRMIREARRLGLRIMIGCMTESSVGISAAAQLLPLADLADLDGALLLSNDPARGVSVEQGSVQLGRRPGIGLDL
jgi:L-alanine-DL-glutamate epimerase-like enolase superfamily enzyme